MGYVWVINYYILTLSLPKVMKRWTDQLCEHCNQDLLSYALLQLHYWPAELSQQCIILQSHSRSVDDSQRK